MDIPLTEFHAAYLNDITKDRDGNLYVSDLMGNAIYKIDRTDRVTLLARMYAPSGLCYHNDRLYAVGWERPALYGISPEGEVDIITTDTNFRHLDGIDVDSAGQLYFSDRSAGVIYRCCPEGTDLTVVVDHLQNPGDIACDRRHGLLLIPHPESVASLFREHPNGFSIDSAFAS